MVYNFQVYLNILLQLLTFKRFFSPKLFKNISIYYLSFKNSFIDMQFIYPTLSPKLCSCRAGPKGEGL